jgi:hypothetical protein
MIGKCDQMKRKNDLSRDNSKVYDGYSYLRFLFGDLVCSVGTKSNERVDVVVGVYAVFVTENCFFLESSAFKMRNDDDSKNGATLASSI